MLFRSDYAPVLGRYLQPDPLGLAGSYNNLYSYAFQNPVNFSDPSGLRIEDDVNSLQENLLQGLGPEEDALADLGSDVVHERPSHSYTNTFRNVRVSS